MFLLLQRRTLAAAYLLFAVLGLGGLPQAAGARPLALQEEDGLSWAHGYTMVLLEPGTDIHNARRWVQAHGGRVGVLLPPHVLLGWIPESLDADLVGRAGIRSIHRSAAPLEAELADVPTRAAAAAFARIVERRLPQEELLKPGERLPTPPGGSDVFVADGISESEVLDNLRAQNVRNLWKGGSRGGASLTANSDIMVGTVALTLFFVESDGSSTDPDQFTWTASAEQDLFDEAVAGLSWWSDRASEHGDCWVTFVLQAHFATQDPRCEQPREPVLHDSATYASIVSNVLGNFGFGTGSHLSRATAYNTAQRLALGTDWAYSAFVAANPTGAKQFTDGYAAWAYFGGPYTALLQRSFTWQFRRVFAHETGHIFGACDEYYEAGYGGCHGCTECWTTGVDNGNCEQCNVNSVACMMKENTWNLCGWTPGQLGWWRSPCTAGPLPLPQVSALSPSSMAQAESGSIDIAGVNFNPGSSVDLGPGVAIESVTWVSHDLLRLQVDVDAETASGWRDVVITGPDGGKSTATSAFSVRRTGVHYVSQYGSNSFPYDAPTKASADLAAVLAVASSGDTLRLTAGTWPGMHLHKNLVIEGGWAHDFSARLPQVLVTTLQPTSGPAIRVTSGAAPVLDGLVVRGGRGMPISSPQLGTTVSGGGAVVVDAAPQFRNCTFEDNRVGSTSQDGVGGAAFLFRSNASFDACTFLNNAAGDGGAVYALESSVTLRDNHFESNRVEPLWGTAQGGALCLHASTASLTGDVMAGNTGAWRGGGVAALAGSSVEATDAEWLGHSVTGAGGALWSSASAVQLFACRIHDNHAATSGGGVYAQGGSLEVHASRFTGNIASTLGGGVYADNNAPQLHNLSFAGNAGGPASGLYLANLQSGSALRNSVLAFNTLGGLIFASGAPPQLDWNVYWQNGGLDVLGATMGPNDALVDPLWVDVVASDVHPGRHSPLVDRGDTALTDPDGSRSDRGAYGGAHARSQAPPRTQGLLSQASLTGTRLTWNPSTANDVSGYLVYRGDSEDFDPGAGTFLAEVAKPTTSWEDVQPLSGSWYKVTAVDADGHMGAYSRAAQMQHPTDATPAPPRFELRPIFPNPTNPSATVTFALPSPMMASLLVYDARGRQVRTLASGVMPAGDHQVLWDGRCDDGSGAGSGVYWVRLHTSQKSFARKLILVR